MVLRYVKALIALLATALAVFAMAAVVDTKHSLGRNDHIGIALIVLCWAPIVIATVTAPARWLERQLRSEDAGHTAIAEDAELTLMETSTVRIALVGFGLAGVSIIISLLQGHLSTTARVCSIVVGVVATAGVAAAIARWGAGRTAKRLLAG